jgi:hypothetical protein
MLHGFLCRAMQGRKKCARRQENAKKHAEEDKKNKQALDRQSSISELLKHLFLNLIFKHGDF